MRRDDIFASHVIRSIDAIGAAYECYHRYSEIRRGKLHQKVHLDEYAYFNKAKMIDTSVPGVYDIRSLAKYKYPVKAFCNSISCD